MNMFLDYLRQPSTWRGLIAILSGLGIYISPDLMTAIVAFGASAFGLVEVIRNEKGE